MTDSTRKNSSGAAQPSSNQRENRPLISERLAQFERKQSELWRITFFLLLVLSIVFAWVSWSTIRSLPHRFEPLPVGLVILVVLFGAYAWKRTREISELRGMVRGIEHRDSEPASEQQLDQLFQVIERSQQGYRDLIDSFDDVLLALTLDGEVRAVNRSFADMVGLPFQEIIGRPLTNFLDEGSGEGAYLIAQAMPRFLERRHWTGVAQVRLKGRQSIMYFDCVAHAMMRGDKVHGVTVLGRDITALRKNEARFTELFETLQEGIYIVTPEDEILDANPALVSMLGYDSKEELLSCKLSEIVPDPAQRRLLQTEIAAQPMLKGREISLVRKNGSPLICLNTSGAVRDTQGRIVRYHGALMDITERREMERRLHQQQEFARRLIGSFPDLILVLDSSARYTFISPRIKDVLGYSPDDSDAQVLGDRTHPEDRKELREQFDEIIAGRSSLTSVEIRVRHKQGDWRRMKCNFSPLSDEMGKIDGVIISGRDVTVAKRLEEKLIQAEKLASMGQMLAAVAHELNNPLTAILGMTELLREREGIDENGKRQLELTHRQARRAARIVQNLLEFSRPASPQKQALDVNSLVERTLQLHDHSLRRNSVEVDFQPQPNLPSVLGDANQIIQVFLNLVSNAEHAIREVRETGRIQIRIGRLGDHISVTVQDDGVGISAEALPRIFDPFYSTKRPGGGTGLGLSICMSIIREHGGSIDVETLPAGGTAFTVYLPVATEQSQSAAPSVMDTGILTAQVVRSASEILKDRFVLVLDDEESIRMLLDEGLSAHGLHVDCAATPEQAIDLAGRHSYDAVLCDLNLSSGGVTTDGLAVSERILSLPGARKPAIILMTGELVDSEEVVVGGPLRLQKPFRISEVLTALREAISAS